MLLDEIKGIKSEKKDLRSFGLVVGGVLVLLGAALLWFGRSPYPYFLATGFALVLSGLLVPRVLLPLQKAWMALALCIGWVMTRVILCVLFYLVISPIGLLARLFGKSFLALEIDGSRESYWGYREDKEPEPETHERQF